MKSWPELSTLFRAEKRNASTQAPRRSGFAPTRSPNFRRRAIAWEGSAQLVDLSLEVIQKLAADMAVVGQEFAPDPCLAHVIWGLGQSGRLPIPSDRCARGQMRDLSHIIRTPGITPNAVSLVTQAGFEPATT